MAENRVGSRRKPRLQPVPDIAPDILGRLARLPSPGSSAHLQPLAVCKAFSQPPTGGSTQEGRGGDPAAALPPDVAASMREFIEAMSRPETDLEQKVWAPCVFPRSYTGALALLGCTWVLHKLAAPAAVTLCCPSLHHSS